MTSAKYGLGQLICGTGGALLIVSLFLPWTGGAAVDLSGWELWTMADVARHLRLPRRRKP